MPAPPTDSFRVAGAPFADSLTVHVHLPAGYDASQRYPVLYTSTGEVYFRRMRLPATLDSARAVGMRSVIAVALPDVEPWGVSRPGTEELAAYRRIVVDHIVPAIEARYAASPVREHRWLLGFSAGANITIDLAAAHPALFGRVASQSPGWMFREREGEGIALEFTDAAVRSIAAGPEGALPAFWFMWGDADEEWERRSRSNGERVIAALRARRASVDEPLLIPGGHGLGLIEGSLRAALAFLVADPT